MKDERLGELRDRARHVATQTGVLEKAETLVAFFGSVARKIQDDGICIPLNDNRVRVCDMSHCPQLQFDDLAPALVDKDKQLWVAFLRELHDKLHTEFSQILRNYTKQAEALRDEALCDVCGAPLEPSDTRQPRGVKIREK